MRSCKRQGCAIPPQNRRSDGWWCDEHDPLRPVPLATDYVDFLPSGTSDLPVRELIAS
jgi:hypothetical protein